MKKNEEHAIERAKQRYGIDITKDQLKMLASNISQGMGVKISSKDGRSVYMVKIDGIVAKCVVSDVLKHVITFLPEGHMTVRKEIYKSPQKKPRKQFYTRRESRKRNKLGRAKQHR